MRFPNAAKGVSRIFVAEILALIAEVLIFIGAIMAILAVAAGTTGRDGLAAGSGLGALGIIGIAGILALIGFIMNIVGIVNASRDEESFKTALYCLLVGIVASVIASAFSTNVFVSNLCSIISNLMSLIVTIMVITGIIKLANRLHNAAVSAKGNTQLRLIVIIYTLSLICNVIVTFLGGQAASTIAGVLAVIASILSIIQYILYIIFLAKAKNMLATSR